MRSFPLVSVSILFALGIVLVKFAATPFLILYGLALPALALSLILLKWKGSAAFILAFYFLLGGSFYSNAVTLPANHLSVFTIPSGKTIFLKGAIASFPQKKTINKSVRASFILEVKEVKLLDKWQRASARVLASSFRPQDFSFADYVILQGKLFKPKHFFLGRNFSYADYLSRQGISYIFSVKKQNYFQVVARDRANSLMLISYKAKKAMQGIIQGNLPSPESGILEAFILGERSNLSREINHLFVQTGTVHILAISGFNVGIVIFLVLILLKVLRIPRKLRFLLTILFIVVFAIITGSQPSVIRASIMAVAILLGILLERETNIYNSLSLAALIILAANPQALFDIGFQLSFISVVSIVWLFGKIERLLLKWLKPKSKILIWGLRSICVSLSAWLGTVGLVAYYFSILSPITVVANLFIVPFSSLIVAMGFCLVCVGFILPPLAHIFAASTKLCLGLLVAGVYLFSKLPAASFYLYPVSLYQVWLYYLAVILAFRLIRAPVKNTV